MCFTISFQKTPESNSDHQLKATYNAISNYQTLSEAHWDENGGTGVVSEAEKKVWNEFIAVKVGCCRFLLYYLLKIRTESPEYPSFVYMARAKLLKHLLIYTPSFPLLQHPPLWS